MMLFRTGASLKGKLIFNVQTELKLYFHFKLMGSKSTFSFQN